MANHPPSGQVLPRIKEEVAREFYSLNRSLIYYENEDTAEYCLGRPGLYNWPQAEPLVKHRKFSSRGETVLRDKLKSEYADGNGIDDDNLVDWNRFLIQSANSGSLTRDGQWCRPDDQPDRTIVAIVEPPQSEYDALKNEIRIMMIEMVAKKCAERHDENCTECQAKVTDAMVERLTARVTTVADKTLMMKVDVLLNRNRSDYVDSQFPLLPYRFNRRRRETQLGDWLSVAAVCAYQNVAGHISKRVLERTNERIRDCFGPTSQVHDSDDGSGMYRRGVRALQERNARNELKRNAKKKKVELLDRDTDEMEEIEPNAKSENEVLEKEKQHDVVVQQLENAELSKLLLLSTYASSVTLRWTKSDSN
eukprot:CFRG3894T1